MKNIILIIVISFSFNVFSQNDERLTGIWLKAPSKKKGLKFMKNGDFELYNSKDSAKRQLHFNVKYKTSTLDGIDYIVFSYYKDGELLHEEKNKYKIENKKLYLSKENEKPKKNTIVNYTDVYISLGDN